MATATPGVIYFPKSSAELREQFLQDYALAAIEADFDEPPVAPGTDIYFIGEAVSKICLIGLANTAISAKSVNILTATGADLDAIREAYGIDEVEPSGSSGKIVVTIAGSTTIGSGQAFKLPNGLRGHVVGTYINPADQAEIDVTADDVGSLTNLAAGGEVEFVAAPTNVAAKAKVSNSFPLTGGTDVESDTRKRDRILNVLRNKPGGGNWGQIRQLVLDEHGFVQDCYVFPAPGGPSSQLIVPVREFDKANNDYSRAPSAALLQAIRGTVQAESNVGIESVIRAADEEDADFAIEIEIPSSQLSGGNGEGWTDPEPWPQLEVADGGYVTITAVGASNDSITVDAATTTEPLDGQTNVAWWSPADRKFYTALVTDHSGATTAWVLTLDRPLVGKNGVGPAAGDYISPNAQNLSAYGDTWVSMFNELGPGEVTSDVNGRLPRSKRHPYTTDEDPSTLSRTVLSKLNQQHTEITDIAFTYSPTTAPTVPASVDDPPAVLIPRHLAFYPT
jgi:uncharacterized phage protein gp47/JayE